MFAQTSNIDESSFWKDDKEPKANAAVWFTSSAEARRSRQYGTHEISVVRTGRIPGA